MTSASARKAPLVELSPVAATADTERERPAMVAQAEVQGRKTSHREADDVGTVLADRFKHR